MAVRVALGPLVLAASLALGGLTAGEARGAPWQSGDVEAAERYRTLERERALRYRAALGERAGAPEPSGRGAARPPRDETARAPRSERVPRARTQRPEAPREARPGERSPALFEAWVERLALRFWSALHEALVRAVSSLWHELGAWLDERLASLDERLAGADRDPTARRSDWRQAR